MRHEVKAPMGGSVESHVAYIGQHVEIGAVILTIECMKTMFPIEAPVAGVVASMKACAEKFEVDDVVAEIDVP